MLSRLLIPAVLGLAFALPAASAPATPSSSANGAATTSSSANGTYATQNDPSSAQQGTPKIAAKLRQSLAQAGFTDVRIMPRSFLVHAKDSDGNPVMMVINPDSVTAVTAMGAMQGNGSSKGTTSSAPPSTGSGTVTKE